MWLCKHGPLVEGVSLPQRGAYRLPACRRRTVLVSDQFLTSS